MSDAGAKHLCLRVYESLTTHCDRSPVPADDKTTD